MERNVRGTGVNSLDPELLEKVKGMSIVEILDLELRYCEWVRQLETLWQQMKADEERQQDGDGGIGFAG